ncbi:MAG: prepilin-type N-terminal cleavage/methylation domain-containing protein [Candidatus Sumerlaeaceae bacterium]
MNKKLGFTLIELLIVVAIIAILAAIAVPNFLEAQVRAKASRAKSDLRTIITALETYMVDENKYPVPRYILKLQTPLNSGCQFAPGGQHETGNAGSFIAGSNVAGLTSPIAYLTSIPKDPFAISAFDNLHDDLAYQNIDIWCEPGQGIPLPTAESTTPGGGGNGQSNFFTGTTAADLRAKYGSWIVRSIGPDKTFNSAAQPYDSTNGSISWGDIYRTHFRLKNNRAVGGE